MRVFFHLVNGSEKAMATHSSTVAWKIPWIKEPGGLQSTGSLRVGRDQADFPFTFRFHALEKEMATHSSVLAWRIPGTGEPGGLPSLGSHRVGHDWSDLTAAAAVNGYLYIFSLIWSQDLDSIISRTAIFKMGSSNRQHHLEVCEKNKILGPTPGLLNQKLLACEAICVLTNSPGDSNSNACKLES